MAEKRRDKKGRLLQSGESQRKDGTYQYRYKDQTKKWKYVYAGSLSELRRKEVEIQKALDSGMDYAAGQITVVELVEKRLNHLVKIRPTTKHAYTTYLNIIKKDEFGYRKISTVKPSDAKAYLIKLSEEYGYAYGTINSIKVLLGYSFQMALEDDAVLRNPFYLRLRRIIQPKKKERNALTSEQQERFLEFVQQGTCSRKHYDEIVILLETGLRISELYGLTLNDIDIDNRRISVNKQLRRDDHGRRYVELTKSEKGKRNIPLTKAAVEAFERVLEARKTPQREVMIDGVEGFIFLDRKGNPKTANNLQRSMQAIVRNYNECHEEQIEATPHVLRHTYSTELGKAGVNQKSHQYLMGHSDIRTTMNIYTHVDYEFVENDFFLVMEQ